MKIIFAGTPDFSAKILSTLIKENKYDIPLVLSQPDRPKGRGKKLLATPVKAIAIENNIEILQPTKLANNQEIINAIKNLNPDLIIVVAYGMIIPQEILDIPKHGCINIHTSLLPRWRGAAPIQRSIEAGDTKSGVTIMQMDAGLDTGNILLSKECNITDEDDTKSLTDKLLEISCTQIINVIDNIKSLIKNSIKQNSIENVEITYAKKISKEEAHVNWNLPAKIISQKIRAFFPMPGAFGFIEDTRVKIIKIETIKLENKDISNLAPGTIIELNKKNLLVKTKDSDHCINILEAQLPGTKPLKISDILNSNYKNIFTKNNQFI